MRLFIAIELSGEVRAALAEVQRGLKDWSKTVRWVEPAMLHLTVKFLGEVGDDKVSSVGQATSDAAAATGSFDLALTECGCFPPRGPVRIVWVGARDDSGRLAALVDGVETRMDSLGFPREERPFSPHLTIGRVREDHSGGKLRAAVEKVGVKAVRQRVSQVSLMQSRLSPNGATYSVLSKANLAEK